MRLFCTACAAQVLFVPSLWPEAFGIVAMEAALRGVPTVSTTSGGLKEANPVDDLRKTARVVYDCLRSELRHDTTLGNEEADWLRARGDWADIAYVKPSQPPTFWKWRDNKKRRGAPHAYDVGSTLFAAATNGHCKDPSLVDAMLGLAHARQTGSLSPDQATVETRLAAFLDPAFQDAFDGKGIAEVSKLFATVTDEEAQPFVTLIQHLLSDDVAYARAADAALRNARAHVADRRDKLSDLLRA